MRAKIEELETNIKIQKIKDLYRGISDFKKGNQPRSISPSYSTCMGLRMLCRQKYTQQNH